VLKNDLIDLGRLTPPNRFVMPVELRAAIDHLLGMLQQIVSTAELPNKEEFDTRIGACRQTTLAGDDIGLIVQMCEQCCVACSEMLSTAQRQKAKYNQEVAELVTLVREALATVATDVAGFNTSVTDSVTRVEALARIDDLKTLRIELIKEARALRQVAVERQKVWEQTREAFARRVQVLEQQIAASKADAAVDPLTQIANRATFDNKLRTWLESGKTQFVLALIDVDKFKTINDTHGHPVGDRVLTKVAQLLKSSVRSDDLAARYGGDEFAVLVGGLNLRQAENRLDAVRTKLAASPIEVHNGLPFVVTLSCGIAEFSSGDTPDSLVQRSDTALYDAKRQGRNRVVTRVKPTLSDMMSSPGRLQ
jgi:diguanylate cyclase